MTNSDSSKPVVTTDAAAHVGMTDLELTRLAAEAMGYAILAQNTRRGAIPLYVARKDDAGREWSLMFDPLDDDAQAMALARRYAMTVDFFCGSASIPGDGGNKFIAFNDESINRAIVECCARMQRAKGTP